MIKTRLEAFLVIYALALGAIARGSDYLAQYPGMGGKFLFTACVGSVAVAAAKIVDCLGFERRGQSAPLHHDED